MQDLWDHPEFTIRADRVTERKSTGARQGPITMGGHVNLKMASAPGMQDFKCRKMAGAVLDGRKELERAAVENLGLLSFAVTRIYEVLIDQVGAIQGPS